MDLNEPTQIDELNKNNVKPSINKPYIVNLSNDSTSASSSNSLTSSQNNLENSVNVNNNSTNKTSNLSDKTEQDPLNSSEMYNKNHNNITNKYKSNNNINNNSNHIRRNSKSVEREASRSSATNSLNNNSLYRRHQSANARRQSNLYNSASNASVYSSIFYDSLLKNQDLIFDSANGDEFSTGVNGSSKSCCLDCGAYGFVSRCTSHCDLLVCEVCQEKHWQAEINELIKLKSCLENNVYELKKYLAAKKSQCNDNIKSGQQIKKFINMTMQQIKRKVELELENKRDELFNSIDAFVENQKKIGSSINEDTFQTTERICSQIENVLLNSDNDLNLIKVKSLKTFAKSYIQKLYQQKQSRIPLYSIFFVPDSTIQVNNSFGKIVLKSHNTDGNSDTGFSDVNSNVDLNDANLDDLDLSDIVLNDGFENSEMVFNNDESIIRNGSINYLTRPRVQSRPTSSYNPKWNSNDNMYDMMDKGSNLNRRSAQIFSNNYRNMSSSSSGSSNQHVKLSKSASIHNTSALSDLPDSYEEVFARRTPQPKEDTRQDVSSADEDDSISSKPFIPGKVLIQKTGEQRTQLRSTRPLSTYKLAPRNQSQPVFPDSDRPRFKTVDYTNFQNKISENGLKENYENSDSNRAIISSTSSEATGSSDSPPASPESPLSLSNNSNSGVKSFKKQILNQAPRLVNF